MRHFFFILLLSLTASTAASQTVPGNNLTILRHDFADTIAIEYTDGQVYVPVEIGGTTYRFNLDTGAGQGFLPFGSSVPQLAELGNIVSRDANNVADTIKAALLPTLHIGNTAIDGYAVMVAQSAQNIPAGYDGTIGFDLFRADLVAKIDVAAKHLILSDRRKWFAQEEGYAIKYRLKWFVPYVMVSPFMRHTDEVLFDTGSRRLYTMNKESFDRHVYKSKQVAAQVEGRATGRLNIGAYSTEQREEVAFLRLNRLKWNDFSFLDVRALTTSGTSRIGAEVLNHGAVIIDPFKQRLIFQPYNHADSIVVGNKHVETAFVPVDGKAFVGLIWEESVAFKNGMREGDEVVAVNGEAIENFGQFTRIPMGEGTRNRFLLRDKDGRFKEVVIEK